MKKLFATLAVIFLFNVCSAQEIYFRPIPLKEAHAEAINYLKTQKLKAKKAKWFRSESGVYMADYQKKKASKIAFYFNPSGQLLFKRVPIQQSDLPKELLDTFGDRMKGPGTKLSLFKGVYFNVYAISIPYGENMFVTKYFTGDGKQYEMNFK